MTVRSSITKRIITSYIYIIVSTLLVVGIVFSLLARYYTERQTRVQLTKDAIKISDIVAEETALGKDVTSVEVRQEIRRKVFELVGTMESNFVLVSKNFKILYPKTEEAVQFREQILPKIKNKLVTATKKTVTTRVHTDNEEYILVVFPSKGSVFQGLKGWVILYDPVGPVQKLIRSLIFVLFISLLVTAIMAVIAGTFVAKSFAKPVVRLMERAEAVSKRNFDGKTGINTGDELEELGRKIDKMASELKEYDIMQRRFFQNASHELKTPLMSIQGYAEGVKDGVFENNGEALDIIVEESKRLKGIVDELIFLSKIETQEDFYKYSIVSINDLIEKSVAKVKGLSIKDNISMNLMLYKDANLRIDRDKITQALVNVMGNCMRYAKSEVNIITSNDDKEFEIKICDNGDGFNESESEKIFERFYKGKMGGSGLGLAITKAIIEKHGGTIKAANSAAGGAEFQIKLPIV